MDKKKKIIIIIVTVVLVIAAGTAIYFAVSKNNVEYVDMLVTEVVTDANGETVTDADGQPVTQVVTQPNGTPQTSKVPQNDNTANNNTANGGNQGSNNQGNAGSNNQGANSGNGGNSGNNGGNADDNKTPEEEKPEDKKPKNRKITITAALPQNYNPTDVMEIWVNGEKDSEVALADFEITQNLIVVTTENKYKDKVTVEVVLQKYKTKTKGTVLNNHEEVRFDFPLNSVEGFTGEDD